MVADRMRINLPLELAVDVKAKLAQIVHDRQPRPSARFELHRRNDLAVPPRALALCAGNALVLAAPRHLQIFNPVFIARPFFPHSFNGVTEKVIAPPSRSENVEA